MDVRIKNKDAFEVQTLILIENYCSNIGAIKALIEVLCESNEDVELALQIWREESKNAKEILMTYLKVTYDFDLPLDFLNGIGNSE